MTNDERKPVVVGIDGSTAALDAARWAVSEAMARDVPLRLVHVAYTPRTLVDLELTDEEREYGEQSLRTASTAAEAMGQPVKIEADLMWGLPSDVLLAESSHASMICLGTSGLGTVARAVLGSTAATVAERAHCSVAVIRATTDARGRPENWVAVGVDDRPDAEVAVRAALDEARIRHAAVVAVGLGCNAFGVNTAEHTEHRVDRWRSVYPDVAIDVVTAPGGLAEFLVDHRDELALRSASSEDTPGGGRAQPLAVVAGPAVDELSSIVGPHAQAVRKHPQCSVLVAR